MYCCFIFVSSMETQRNPSAIESQGHDLFLVCGKFFYKNSEISFIYSKA